MKIQGMVLSVLCVMLSATAYSQSSTQNRWPGKVSALDLKMVVQLPTGTTTGTIGSDSTRLYQIPVWRLDRMVNEVIISRGREAFLVELQLENSLQAKRLKAMDSAYAFLQRQVDQLKQANVDHDVAYSSLTKALGDQAKEIRKQKRLKLLFAALLGVVLVIDHAR